MSICTKCGHDPDKDKCPFCGELSQTLGNYGGKLLTICCRKDPNKQTKAVK